jgi:hypothetical protein
MGVLAWLIVPAVATVVAIVWVNWSARPRGPVETHESLAERERFVNAMARPVAASARRAPVQRAPRTVEQPERRAS